MRAFLQRALIPLPVQPEFADDPDPLEAEMTNMEPILPGYESDLSSDNESLVDTGEIQFQGSSTSEFDDGERDLPKK